MSIDTLILKTDGAARGNPGPAGIGVVIQDEQGNTVDEAAEFIGVATNNVAEYRGLIHGLQKALSLGGVSLKVFLDSELLVKQLSGEYRVKNTNLKDLFIAAKALLDKFKSVEIKHVPREENREADKLANQAIDQIDARRIQEETALDTGQGKLF